MQVLAGGSWSWVPPRDAAGGWLAQHSHASMQANAAAAAAANAAAAADAAYVLLRLHVGCQCEGEIIDSMCAESMLEIQQGGHAEAIWMWARSRWQDGKKARDPRSERLRCVQR